MANEKKHQACEHFYDVYEKPGTQTGKDLEELNKRNKRNARIYKAVRVVLEKDFNIKSMPPRPEDFPGGLKDKEKDLAQVVAILGVIHADNWQDPSNGKTSPNPDDLLDEDKHVVDRRFVDAVVDAVKEYTSASDLFSNVFELMLAEAAEGPSSTTSTKA